MIHMSGRRHGNTNPVGQRNSNNASRFKWTYEQEKTLIELYDQAISMNHYTLKDPTVLGREHMVDNFNRAFNLNINYAFFKNKLDDFKKAYKKWKFLMTSTGIMVTPETSMIYASDEWWEAQVRNVQDVVVVQKELEDVGALLKHLLETQELMLEVLQEVIEEDNHSRLQYKTPLMDIKNFNDKVYNSYAQYFIDIARSNDEDKLQLLEAMTGVSRNNEDVPKQLGSGQLFGSPHFGGLSSGSPSSVGNCSRGNNFQNLGAPPTTQQWGTPPNVQHWGTPPNMQHWGTPPNVEYWGTSPNAQPWGQTGSSGTTPTNVHYGFTILHQRSTNHHQLVSVSLIILNQETHHKDRDVEDYSIFGELQKNLMKRINVVQEMKSSNLIV
ncbi:hypothetical protein HID58_070232, partial [Brassica napus]